MYSTCRPDSGFLMAFDTRRDRSKEMVNQRAGTLCNNRTVRGALYKRGRFTFDYMNTVAVVAGRLKPIASSFKVYIL